VPSTNRLWKISQHTKPNANSIPSANSSQNQRANRARARSAMPTTIGATHPATPRSGLGKPKTLPCQDSRFAEHCTSELKSHEAIAFGSSSLCRRSIVSVNAAHQPMTPAITSHTASTVGRVWV
jgi:hypothetical protein